MIAVIRRSSAVLFPVPRIPGFIYLLRCSQLLNSRLCLELDYFLISYRRGSDFMAGTTDNTAPRGPCTTPPVRSAHRHVRLLVGNQPRGVSEKYGGASSSIA